MVVKKAKVVHESLGRGGWMLLLAICWVSLWATMWLWPATYYFEPRKLVVPDTKPYTPVIMSFEREIHKNFLGKWSVTVRKFSAGGPVVVCAADGKANYRTDSVLPNPLTLDWWTGGVCQTLPEGDYMISTSWEIHPILWPEKQIGIDSNVFHVGNGKDGSRNF